MLYFSKKYKLKYKCLLIWWCFNIDWEGKFIKKIWILRKIEPKNDEVINFLCRIFEELVDIISNFFRINAFESEIGKDNCYKKTLFYVFISNTVSISIDKIFKRVLFILHLLSSHTLKTPYNVMSYGEYWRMFTWK